MMSKHPLDLQPGRKLVREEVAEALRLSIIAELDAINLYLQLARAIDDEKVRKVFEDIAREEKTHVGEFLALLKVLDREQVEELSRGVKEVEELTGTAISDPPKKGDLEGTSTSEDVFKHVASMFKEVFEKQRTLRKYLPIVKLGRGADAAIVEKLVNGRLERIVEKLHEVSVKFKISQRSIDAAVRGGQPIEMVDAYTAARNLALLEDKYIIEKLLTAEDIITLPLGKWDEPEVPLRDVANAVMKLYENGASKPFILLVSPLRYSNMLVVYEKTGVAELERVRRLVDEVVVTPALPDNQVVIISSQPSVLDIVLGGDCEVDYIGPEDGFHVFRAWETIGMRLKFSKGICVLRGV
ncbi:MAG: family 1 encapsulin nanocompartment shell protein [Sulfolobales archaeon]